jgi:hypothetical protein
VSLVCGFCVERGKACADTAPPRWAVPGVVVAKGSVLSGRNREVLSTDAVCAGGPARSSEEASVMEVERRSRLICGLFARATRVIFWEETSEQVRSGRQTVSDTEVAGVGAWCHRVSAPQG